MARTNNLNNYLTDVATAIKTKKGDSTPINAANFDTEIANLPSGGTYDVDCGTVGLMFKSNATGQNYPLQSDIDKLGEMTENIKNIIVQNNSFGTGTNRSITDLSGLKNLIAMSTAAVAGYFPLFYRLTYLKKLPNINFSKVIGNTVAQMFRDCSSLNVIANDYFATMTNANIYNAYQLFYGCTTLKNINCIQYLPKLCYCKEMCSGCILLEDVPVMDLSYLSVLSKSQKSDAVRNMFSTCLNLTNESLHNIIKSLVTLPNDEYTGTKTLQYVGLSSTQASTCTTFTEWATLEANGWTTGY